MKNQDYNHQNDTEAYEMAVKRVKKLKGFYTHLLVYVIINIFIYVVNVRGSHGDYFALQNFVTAFFWGIGLVAHATSVFVPEIIFGKNWEERKIREFMEKEANNKYE